ncbi:hypothetical protein EB796_025205 [Bugula neritina]|uniref:Uncharacterized protein n=1 Tax=Bugula neritina TaxID=10212 RepID=A0A7J7ISE0_BUGNE|nr:hypothetical protein EB796_025205 [Bugula neritina]
MTQFAVISFSNTGSQVKEVVITLAQLSFQQKELYKVIRKCCFNKSIGSNKFKYWHSNLKGNVAIYCNTFAYKRGPEKKP